MIIATALSAAKKGEKVAVRLPNGETKRLIAESDITSTKVLVIGDVAGAAPTARVLSQDVVRSQLIRTTELFKSQTTSIEKIDYPWVYLFEVNDFEDLTISFTDPQWVFDEVEGVWRPVCAGVKAYQSSSAIIDYYNSNFLELNLDPPYYKILQSENNIFIRTSLQVENPQAQVFLGFSPTLPSIALDKRVFSDGVTGAGARLVYRKIDPERRYWVKETGHEDWLYEWQSRSQSGSFLGRIIVKGDGTGEKFRQFIGVGYGYTRDENGVETNIGTNNTVDARERRARIFEDLYSQFIPPTFNSPSGNFNFNIYSGSEILNGFVVLPLNLQGSIPENPTIEGEKKYKLASPRNLIYEARLYLIPEIAPRNPGKKAIYIQVGNNKKTLLHTIPTVEKWDGFVSPVAQRSVEVVLRCGKRKRDPDGDDENISEWSQTRIYTINETGKIINTKISNNAFTTLNPSDLPDRIEVKDDNWQKPWLESFFDYKRSRYVLESNPVYNNTYHLHNRTGDITSLETGYRSYFSDRNTEYIIAVSRGYRRYLIDFASYGTLTSRGFVYLEPENLYSGEFDLSPVFNVLTFLVENPSSAIVSGLINQNVQKSVYYLATASFNGGERLNSILSIEKPTSFPKLDLSDPLIADGVGGDPLFTAGIKAIAFLG